MKHLLVASLESATPVYREHFSPAHDRANSGG
jgi:hypothetical protein